MSIYIHFIAYIVQFAIIFEITGWYTLHCTYSTGHGNRSLQYVKIEENAWSFVIHGTKEIVQTVSNICNEENSHLFLPDAPSSAYTVY